MDHLSASDQRQFVERDYNGPARVSGSAGTGKTIVALHRAAHLARTNPDARVLLTTFSEGLATALRTKLRLLISSEPRLAERIEVAALDAVGLRLYEASFGKVKLAAASDVRTRLAKHAANVSGTRFGESFLSGEWQQIVDAWQLQNWEDYRDVKRLGRKTRLSEAQRQSLWSVFSTVQQELQDDGLISMAGVFTRLAGEVAQRRHPPFEHVVLDEAQDVTVAQLRFLAAVGGTRPNALFFAGDLGQRIFQMAFSWKSLGVDVRGRSRTLTVNYRTSHQIRAQADRLLGEEIADVDGNRESARARCRCSTVQRRRCMSSRRRMPRSRPWATGSKRKSMPDWLRTRSACLFAAVPNLIAPSKPYNTLACLSWSWTRKCSHWWAKRQLPPCTLPRGWSSAPSQ